MSDKVSELASVHLGKAGDGSVVKPYVTPDTIDSSLLVPIPRELNRKDYGIMSYDFVGFDRWNAYEVSTLLKNRFPVSGRVVLTYNSNSPNIVESKSLKLYLNSFNMHMFNTLNIPELIASVEFQIASDFRNIGIVLSYVEFIPDNIAPRAKRVDAAVKDVDTYCSLENFVLQDKDFDNEVFAFEGESPDYLEVRYNTAGIYAYSSSSLRSNCRVTNQPDWGDIYIKYRVRKQNLHPTNLFKYIISLRTENHFHEEICEVVYKRIKDALNPVDLMVACNYTRRGGIDINPVRASSTNFLSENINTPRYVDIMKEKRQ